MEAKNVMKSILTILISFGLVISVFGQTRNVVVGTNGAVVQPTNFWSADVTNARSGLGLGSAATNPASAFQPSSTVLSNLASSNGLSLTNIQASNIVGQINISNVSAVSLTNIGGILAISQGGTGATNQSDARSNLGLGSSATNASSAFQPASLVLSNLSFSNAAGLTNVAASSIVGTVAVASNITGTAPLATNVTGVVALANGGTAGTNASSARASLGATTVGANFFTLPNPDDVRFLRINANNTVSTLNAADFRIALSVDTNVGTVTSVGMTVPSIFSLSTPTITSSGTFAITLANQTSRQVFIAPNGGGIPTFRAIESDDLPSLAISKITGLQTALDGKLSTSGTAALATNVTGIVALANGGTGGTNAESGRLNLGGTTIGSGLFTLPNPSAIRFIRLNADNTVSALSESDFRNAISLGSAATNLASAFQPSSSMLTNLASSNAFYLSNVQASNITGLLGLTNGGTGADNAINARANLGLGSASTNPASAFQPSSTVLSNLANSNGVDLTNITISNLTGVLTTNGNAVGLTNFPTYLLRTNGDGAGLTNLTAANITGTVALASNVTGTIAISNGGIGATNAAIARTNLGLGSTNNAFSSLSVGVDITNSSTSSNASSAFGRQITIDSTVENSIAVGFGHSMSNFGNQAGGSVLLGGRGVMTNWGAFLFNGVEQGGTIGYSMGNSTFAVIASNGIYLDGPIKLTDVQGVATDTGILQISAGGVISRVMTNKSTATPAFFGWSGFSNTAFSAAEVRTNLGLAWPALTNSNAGTGLVSVNTNGEVVSPTNFWDVAPIQTLVQNFTPVANATNAATNARTLYVYSMALSTTGVTHVITLPTNTATKNGDEVTVIHMGPTSSVTAIRQLGQTNNLITINKTDESVKFIYENNAWTNFHNISFVEPIQFSGTNTSVNAAASRTNLGLGTTNNVIFNDVQAFSFLVGDETNSAISFEGDSAARTRTNLGIPLAALTNTNNAKFQEAIFATNTAPTNAGNFGDHAAWMGVSIVTNGVTNVFKIPLYK